MRRAVTFTTCAVAVLIAACATTSTGHEMQEIAVEENTTQIVGWLNTGAEWALFPQSSFHNYDPYSGIEEQKCISIIKEIDDLPMSERLLHGSQVVLYGRSIRYDDLELSDDIIDLILPKRYYNGRIVINGCAREFVFLATSLEVIHD